MTELEIQSTIFKFTEFYEFESRLKSAKNRFQLNGLKSWNIKYNF